MLCFGDEGPDTGPDPIGEEQLRGSFNSSHGWDVAAIKPDRIQTRYHSSRSNPAKSRSPALTKPNLRFPADDQPSVDRPSLTESALIGPGLKKHCQGSYLIGSFIRQTVQPPALLPA